MIIHLISIFFIICQSCAHEPISREASVSKVIPAADRTEEYVHLLEGKRVGLVVNQTSMVGNMHLVDTLIKRKINVIRLFAPEHGLRGTADAGEVIKDGVDTKTGVRVVSLYGNKKKPAAEDLEGVDVVVFDIQDVGVRFYTYISTLHYLMESLAEADIPLIILDRPNPNGHYVDGPILHTTFQSFVGMHPVPVVHGMTIGEYAQMINGEGWVPSCALQVIRCAAYDHCTPYVLPVKPSPNLPNQRSVLLYPGICFFEGTIASLGRGTSFPFQVAGHPDYPVKSFSFTPMPVPGAMTPPLQGQTCYGVDLTAANVDSLWQLKHFDLSVLIHFYKTMDRDDFFNASWFDKLAGGEGLRKNIIAGMSEHEIRATWKKDLDAFRVKRSQYLLYPDCPE